MGLNEWKVELKKYASNYTKGLFAKVIRTLELSGEDKKNWIRAFGLLVEEVGKREQGFSRKINPSGSVAESTAVQIAGTQNQNPLL